MLTADLVKSRLRIRGSEISLDMLNEHDPYWLQTATDLIALFRQHQDQSQETWHKTLEAYEGERIDYIVVRGLAKVLADAATFTPLATLLPPLQLRERLFAYGPVFTTPQLFHPQARTEVVQSVANELGMCVDQIEATTVVAISDQRRIVQHQPGRRGRGGGQEREREQHGSVHGATEAARHGKSKADFC